MIEIRLNEMTWYYDSDRPLATGGGFGKVFLGASSNDEPVAVKRLKVDAKAATKREFRIADTLLSSSHLNVIPILDYGFDESSGRYFLVMPVAERSLQQALDLNGPFELRETVEVMLAIANGLSEVREITHRDLKPDNVLFHRGVWKIADFGIARFVEDSTSLNTLRDRGTPQYAAPEQWNLERADGSTDIYALGCIGYALLTGSPPFKGPDFEDYRHQHLTATPPALPEDFTGLTPLLLSMLRKRKSLRPSLARVMQGLSHMLSGSGSGGRGPGLEALAKAGVNAAKEEARIEAELAAVQERTDRRIRRASESTEILEQLLGDFTEKIMIAAPMATLESSGSLPLYLILGSASLKATQFTGSMPVAEDIFSESGWDVIAGAFIELAQSEPNLCIRSANFWYADLQAAQAGSSHEYRWWEASYSKLAVPPRTECELYGLTDIREATVASPNPPIFGPNMTPPRIFDPSDPDAIHSEFLDTGERYVLAFELTAIDDVDFDNFVDHWAKLLARAFTGTLGRSTIYHRPAS